MKTVRMIVRGTVQQVGFRAFTVDAARRHGVTGWIRNRGDGSVEIAAQGAGPKFFDEVGAGPRSARVASVDRSEAEETPFDGFEVRW